MHLVVPSTLTLADLLAIAPYRSKNRIPVVTYRHAPTQTCLARSSQPLVGLTRHACGGDALLLEYYRKSGVINEARCACLHLLPSPCGVHVVLRLEVE